MPARRISFAPTDLSLPQARALARAAYKRARGAGGLSSAIIDQLWSDTLMRIEGKPPETAAEMLRRTEHLMVLAEDRARWPR
jgi:hypothetical protein